MVSIEDVIRYERTLSILPKTQVVPASWQGQIAANDCPLVGDSHDEEEEERQDDVKIHHHYEQIRTPLLG